MKKIKFTYPVLFLIVSVLGLAVSIFLWYSTLQIKVIGCLTGGCEAVLSSPFAKIFGVPISAWGVAFYAFTFVLSIYRIVDDRPVHRLTLWPIAAGSIFMSVYFFYLEMVKIHAICFWCKFSTLSTILFLIITILEIKQRGGFKVVSDDLKQIRGIQ